jgi:integrase
MIDQRRIRLNEKPSPRVVTYICPVRHGPIWDIWIDERPIPLFSVYLRREALYKEWSDNTRRNVAYRLLHVARWLADRSDFRPDGPLLRGGDETLAFRSHLRSLTDRGDLSESTAHQIMGDLLALATHWGLRTRLRRGREKRSPAFRFKISEARSPEGEKSLSRQEVTAVWTYLEQDLRPRSGAPRLAQALWARDLILWATLISTGIRASEVIGLFLPDLMRPNGRHLYLAIRDPRLRPHEKWRQTARTDWGAQYKTGSRVVPIWFERRFAYAWRQWVRLRPVLIAKTGTVDHQAMLLAAKPFGAPLGRNAVRYFTGQLTDHCGPFYGVIPGADAFRLTPHRVRHSLTTILRSERVPEPLIAYSLGHTNLRTTADYGTHFQDELDRSRGLLSFLDSGGPRA